MQATLRDCLAACELNVDTRPFIVNVDGLRSLGLDVSLLRDIDIFPWKKKRWVRLSAATEAFGRGAPLPRVCTGAECVAANASGTIKVQTEFSAPGHCKSCVSASVADRYRRASEDRSSSKTRTCQVCGEDKAETSFDGTRKTCSSCRNAQSDLRAVARASAAPDTRKCTGCSRVIPASSATKSCEACLAKGQRHDSLPERRAYHREHQIQHGKRYSRAYRARQLEQNPHGYRAHLAQRMREYVNANWDKINEWRRSWPGTRICALRAHQQELEDAGVRTPPEDLLTNQEITDLITGSECFYCGSSSNGNGSILGVDRLASSRGYSRGNCVAACARCNVSKNTISAQIYIARAVWISLKGDDPELEDSIWHGYATSSFQDYQRKMSVVGGDLTYDDYLRLKEGPCNYCTRKTNTGIDRIDSDIGYWVEDNVVPCCGSCNFMKHTEDAEDFMERMDAIAARHIERPELLGAYPDIPFETRSMYRVIAGVEGDHTSTDASMVANRPTVGATSVSNLLSPEHAAGSSPSSSAGPSSTAGPSSNAAREPCPAPDPPSDTEAFWKALDVKGASTTVFVRLSGFREYVTEEALALFEENLNGEIRKIKVMEVTGGSGEEDVYVNIAQARKAFPELPWPKTCTKCNVRKTVQAFPASGSVCKGCGGTSANVIAHKARIAAAGGQDAVAKAREVAAEKARKRRANATPAHRAAEAARKAAARARMRGE